LVKAGEGVTAKVNSPSATAVEIATVSAGELEPNAKLRIVT
jgi:hypothetical protein